MPFVFVYKHKINRRKTFTDRNKYTEMGDENQDEQILAVSSQK